MNLILLSDKDFLKTNRVKLTGRRFEHVRDILKSKIGDVLSVGKINGLIGQGKIVNIDKDFLEINVGNGRDHSLHQKPPAPLDLIVIMALPRPPMLRRTLQALSSLGVKKIIILNFAKVEKSLWQSSALRPEAIKEDLILGLEQAKDTVLPEVILKRQFKPFVEDELAAIIKNKKAFVAHPGIKKALPRVGKNAVLIIGPEGGLNDFEVNLFKSKGVQIVNLGQRILRFENAITYAIGKMF